MPAAAEPDLARIAATIGDARRIRMLALLMEGRALTAKELALGAGIEPATASAHLKLKSDAIEPDALRSTPTLQSMACTMDAPTTFATASLSMPASSC